MITILTKTCLGIFFGIFSMSLLAAPNKNNACENAKWIEISEAETQLISDNYDNINAYISCEESLDYEFGAISYYKFVVPSTGRIKFKKYGAGFVEFSVKIFAGCNSELLFCKNTTAYYPGVFSSALDTYITVENLNPGDTLIIELTEGVGQFHDLSTTVVWELPPTPNYTSNNTCENPVWVDLNPNGETTKIKIDHSENSINISPTCYLQGGLLADSYFNIIVPPSGMLRFFYEYNYGISIFDNCNNERLFCEHKTYFREGIIDVENLNPGDTLLVQVFQAIPQEINISNHPHYLEFITEPVEFEISVEEIIAPQNSYCGNAQFIEIEDIEFNSFKYQMDLIPYCGSSNSKSDVFYKFKVPNTGAIKLSRNRVFDQYDFCGVALYNNCEEEPLYCTGPEVFYNGDFSPYLAQTTDKIYGSVVVSELNPNDTLILQLFSLYRAPLYKAAFEVVQPTSNNICDNATSIKLKQQGVCSELISFSLKENNLDMLPDCYKDDNPGRDNIIPFADIYYRIEVPSSGSLQFYFQNEVGMAIYDGCNGNTLFCDTKTDGDLRISNLMPGSEIIIQLYNFWYMENTFSFCIENPVLYCHLDDWTALKALYESTNGDEWFIKDGWEVVQYDALPEKCDLSTLFGVGLNANGRVNCIDLDFEYNCTVDTHSIGNNLTGILPNEIGLLSDLTELCLNYNDIGGALPISLGQLNKLKSLWLHGNKFSGKISESIFSNLKKLEVAFLSANQFSGSIPVSLGQCNNLKELGLFQNHLTGNIPESLANLNNLQILNLRNNELSGPIPSQLLGISALKALYLSSNNLDGCYKEELSFLCNQLTEFNISFGNYFNADWEDFCVCNAGSCAELYDILVIDNNTPFQNLYKATGEIKTEGIVHIKNEKDVMFSAKNIFLNNGFEVDKISDFTATYEPCIDANIFQSTFE